MLFYILGIVGVSCRNLIFSKFNIKMSANTIFRSLHTAQNYFILRLLAYSKMHYMCIARETQKKFLSIVSK